MHTVLLLQALYCCKRTGSARALDAGVGAPIEVLPNELLLSLQM